VVDGLLVHDRALFLMVNGLHHPLADAFFLAVTQLGNGWVIGPLLIAIIVIKIPRKHLLKVLLCGVIGMSLSGAINSQIKKKVARLRPVAYWQQQEPLQGGATVNVHQIGTNYTSRSFPSGHTNTAFSAATFLAVLFGRWFFCAYFAAFLVAYSRMYLGVHFPLDVTAGALIAVAFMATFMMVFRCNRAYLAKGSET